jgi:rhamnulokinase
VTPNGTSGAAAPVVVAVDFGASSIRVCRVELGEGAPRVSVVHRHPHAPVDDGSGVLRWDWARLMAETEKGLAAALEAGPVASIGVDTWGVDYGLLDTRGDLVAPPVSYRDGRTDGYRAVVDRLGGAAALYDLTGVQLQPFNTLFQVAAHDPAELQRARHLVMLPELVVHHLTGAIVGERTSAGTTGLVDITTGEWSGALAEGVGLVPGVLPEILPATTRVGAWQGVPVHLVGGHDTASAVVAMGASAGPHPAFVSTGTWLLVGREQADPDVSAAARAANFTNEIGALGGVRFLKNLAGAWLLELCRPAWGDPPVADLVDAAAAVAASGPPESLLDPADPRFLHPDDMLVEVTSALGLTRDAPPAVVTRLVVESLAAATADVLAQLPGDGPGEIHVFGGAQSDLYRRLLAAEAGVPVHAGPVEATALGNALAQGIALGVYRDLADARRRLRHRDAPADPAPAPEGPR